MTSLRPSGGKYCNFIGSRKCIRRRGCHGNGQFYPIEHDLLPEQFRIGCRLRLPLHVRGWLLSNTGSTRLWCQRNSDRTRISDTKRYGKSNKYLIAAVLVDVCAIGTCKIVNKKMSFKIALLWELWMDHAIFIMPNMQEEKIADNFNCFNHPIFTNDEQST